jgi:lipoprotein-anchoring transpeptidase ErfK/SrfK
MCKARTFFLTILLAGSLVASAVSAREVVSYAGNEDPGSIVIRTKERRLYLVLEEGVAIQYRVAVGRSSKQWTGTVQIEGKYVEPAWSPPDEIKRDNPRLPDVIAGGSPRNPMGARAMTLSGGGQYAIHGTNRPDSIGTFASYGCFRMFNEDIIDLFQRVPVGTPVIVRR